jgi:hypothetical protein
VAPQAALATPRSSEASAYEGRKHEPEMRPLGLFDGLRTSKFRVTSSRVERRRGRTKDSSCILDMI